MNRNVVNIYTKHHQVMFTFLDQKLLPGVRRFDADKGAGGDLNVTKKRSHTNDDDLVMSIVKMVTFMVGSMKILYEDKGWMIMLMLMVLMVLVELVLMV